jgi:hypothetical protein
MNRVAPCRTITLVALLTALFAGVAHAEDKALWDTEDQNIVKRSGNNICHDKNDPSFQQTVHFRAYRTMQDCLDSGGKPAKNANPN